MAPLKNPDIYVAGALAGVSPEDLVNYERIGLICEEIGLKAFVPHLEDKTEKPREDEIYEMDRKAVEASKLVLMYAGIKSFGVGQEAEIAKKANVPVVLLCKNGQNISPMLLYCPSVVRVIRFTNWEDGLQQLKNFLRCLRKNK